MTSSPLRLEYLAHSLLVIPIICSASSVQRGKRCRDMRRLDMRSTIKLGFPFLQSMLEFKNEFRVKGNFKLEEKLESFDVAASFKKPAMAEGYTSRA